MIAATAEFAIRISFTATRPAPSAFLEQQLRDHAAQRIGEHRADLCLLIGGKTSIMRSTVLRALFVCRVPKTSRPGFGRGQRKRDGFEIAHFADEHDVGIFAQRRFQSVGNDSVCSAPRAA